jgi:enoyl-CoA hydratase/carnithine racemase
MPIRYERNGSVATFTIENGKVNPLTPQMHKELFLALKEFLADDSVHCGILTGAGERAFCAGDDIKTPYKSESSPKDALYDHLWPHRGEGESPENFAWARDVLFLERFKPIVAAVNGWCLGQGMIYLLNLTDIRVASTNATFGFPEIAYGMGGAGGTTRLAYHLPQAVAMEMLLTGDPMPAQEALRHSLVNRVVEPAQLMAEARRIAQRIASHPPAAVRVEMEAYARGRDLSRLEAIAYSGHMYRLQRLGLRQDGALPESFLYGRAA